jgi:hypothetical protein
MKNKELTLRKLQSLEGRLSQLRQALNELDAMRSREILNELIDLKDEITSLVEREN